MNARVLKWIERSLWTLGGVLAIWCAIVLVRAEYYKRLAVPSPPRATATLPGEGPNESGGVRRREPVAPGTWVAKLEAPSVHLSATVLEGSDDGTLARAAGHIEDTAFPGDAGNVGIAGHRDTTFRAVRNLHAGELLDLVTVDRVFRYRISKTRIVNPNDVWVLDPTDHPTLTLVTCYPFEFIGHAPHRFIVTADLVAEEVRTAGGRRNAGWTGAAGRAGG